LIENWIRFPQIHQSNNPQIHKSCQVKNLGYIMTQAKVKRINGPTAFIEGAGLMKMGDQVYIGELELAGEIIRQEGDVATVQVYEETSGLKPGDNVTSTGHPLSVELGPGLIRGIYDGIQRPLDEIFEESGVFIGRGIRVPSLKQDKKWHFIPAVSEGDEVHENDIIGSVNETELIDHKILVPPNIKGKIKDIVSEGDYTVSEVIGTVVADDGEEKELKLSHKWPVRVPRPVNKRIESNVPLLTGQRVIDFFFTLARGGTAAIPGGFGTGKTVTQHQLAKWSDASVIVYIGCGERGNEMTQVLKEFPELIDPKTGKPLMDRTVLIANTSNMPVTAREASIYTGITIAEYYRDMGHHVAIMADSTSRWAEALREISGRLEEMPAEEGYPAYLASRLAEFYERAGRVEVGGVSSIREGSVSVIGAVSPQGGDFSEPVTQHTRRFVRAFWALDKSLASARHFPSINWNESYSEYVEEVGGWWKDVDHNFNYKKMRDKAMDILQEENKLSQVVKLVGPDALPDKQRILLNTAKLIKDSFLQQNAFHENDVYCSPEKQLRMMDVILYFHDKANEVISKGVPSVRIIDLEILAQIIRMKTNFSNKELDKISKLKEEIDYVLGNL